MDLQPPDTVAISEVERALVAVVEAIDPEPWYQPPTRARWTEMRSFEAQGEASSVTHLRFHAHAESTTTSGTLRGRAYGVDRVSTRLIVTFSYHLRPGRHADDLRNSRDAAQAVVRAVNRACDPRWSPNFESIRNFVDVDRGLAVVSVAFDISHQIEV